MQLITVAVPLLALWARLATCASQATLHEKQYPQQFTDNYSILKHYGGNGPYSDRRSYGISRDPPDSCEVDQVIMIMRHGERYPDPKTGGKIEKSLKKVLSANVTTFQGDLSFLNDGGWEYYVPNYCSYNAETFSGPYGGLLEGFRRGVDYRARYGHLWDEEEIVPIFTSGYSRVLETARKFGEGFFAPNYSTNAAINIIPEDVNWGANSLTPSCTHDDSEGAKVCDSLQTDKWPQFRVAADRLKRQNPGLDVNATDVYNLLSMRHLLLSTGWLGLG